MEHEIRERIIAYNSETEDLRNDIEAYCADVSVELDIRWKLFKESKLGEIDDSYVDFEDLGIDLYSGDVFNEVRKFEHVDLIAAVEDIEVWISNYGKMTEEELPKCEKKKFGKLTDELVVKMKERILDKFVKECIFDCN